MDFGPKMGLLMPLQSVPGAGGVMTGKRGCGFSVGATVGFFISLAYLVDLMVGSSEGSIVGLSLGLFVGAAEGMVVGCTEGLLVGDEVCFP